MLARKSGELADHRRREHRADSGPTECAGERPKTGEREEHREQLEQRHVLDTLDLRLQPAISLQTRPTRNAPKTTCTPTGESRTRRRTYL
jgi:hypothetical protein